MPVRLAFRVASVGAVMLMLAGCQGAAGPTPSAAQAAAAPLGAQLAALERRSGGRLGVVVADEAGQIRHGWRADERFAMCSTFKHLLAGMVLHQATRGGASLRTPLPFGPADMVPYAPDSEKLVDADTGQGTWRLGFAAEAMVVSSDNVAANVVLKQIGGPAALTRWLRQQGDDVTRLDRNEPALNENAPGDGRDTTTPAAMAGMTARLLFGDMLDPRYRQSLADWMVASPTGRARIRAGLPSDWRVGGKTGSCRNAYNEIAFAQTPAGQRMVIAIYLDRPTLNGDAANALIAEAAGLASRAAD